MYNIITSSSNVKLKEVTALLEKSKARKESGHFIIEGTRIFSEVPKELTKEIVCSESYLNKNGEAQMQGLPFTVLSDALFTKLSDTKTPQGVLAVVKQSKYTLEEILQGKAASSKGNEAQPLLLMLEDVQDPGNLGTIMRSAEGAGVTGVILSKGCVDLYNPKTVRSTMGSIFRMPFTYVEDFGEAIQKAQAAGVQVYAAHLAGKKAYEDFDYTKPTAFLIGNEGNGLKEETAKKADSYVIIPMLGKLESLNAGIAASLLSFEAARQRRLG